MSDTRRLNAVSDTELSRRWAVMRAAMAAAGLEAVVVTGFNDWLGGHLRWLTDFPATNGYPRTVIFWADRPMTVVEMGPFGPARELAGTDPVLRGVGRQITRPTFTAVMQTNSLDADLIAAELAGLRHVGLITPQAMPQALVAAIAGVAGLEAHDATEMMDLLKAVKSPEELVHFRATCALQDAAFAHVCDVIRPGMRDVDVANAAMARAQELGSDQGIVLCGSAPMGQAARFNPRQMQGRVIEPGDHFSILIEVNGPGGAYAEIARTIVLGRARPELRESFAQMCAAQQHTLSLLKPGADPAEIAARHDDWMRAHGLPPEIRLYAHGQGGDMVERPLIRHDETLKIAEHQTLAVHPGYDDGSVFAVICDNYTIGADGPGACEHQTEKRLFEIE
jgi:Xaa-Pro aminopeptidase